MGDDPFKSTYFDNGALQTMTFPDDQVLTHGYDAADRLSNRILAFSNPCGVPKLRFAGCGRRA